MKQQLSSIVPLAFTNLCWHFDFLTLKLMFFKCCWGYMSSGVNVYRWKKKWKRRTTCELSCFHLQVNNLMRQKQKQKRTLVSVFLLVIFQFPGTQAASWQADLHTSCGVMTSKLAQPGFCLISRVRSGIWESATPQTICFWLFCIFASWIRVKVEVWLESGETLAHTDLTDQFSVFLLFLSASPNSPIRQVKWLQNQDIMLQHSWKSMGMCVYVCVCVCDMGGFLEIVKDDIGEKVKERHLQRGRKSGAVHPDWWPLLH